MTKTKLFNLRKMRLDNGLSQQKLADIAGIHRITVIEHEKVAPSKLVQKGYIKIFEEIAK